MTLKEREKTSNLIPYQATGRGSTHPGARACTHTQAVPQLFSAPLRIGTGPVPCSPGPTCSASWCLCSAELFSSSAMRVCCCCTTERRCLMQLWFGSSSLGISRLPPRVGEKQNRTIQWDMRAKAGNCPRGFPLAPILNIWAPLFFIPFTSFSPAPPTPAPTPLLSTFSGPLSLSKTVFHLPHGSFLPTDSARALIPSETPYIHSPS